MEAQLHLLPEPDGEQAPDADWRIDDTTKALGRRGIAQARAALRTALRQRHDHPHGEHVSAA